MAKRGRKLGQVMPGTYGGWLKVAKIGDIWWHTGQQRSVSGAAGRAGRKVATMRFYAIAPQTMESIALVRVEMK